MFPSSLKLFILSVWCIQIPSSNSESQSGTQARVLRTTHCPESLICSGAWKEGIRFHWRTLAFCMQDKFLDFLFDFVKDWMFYCLWSRRASKHTKTLKHHISFILNKIEPNNIWSERNWVLVLIQLTDVYYHLFLVCECEILRSQVPKCTKVTKVSNTAWVELIYCLILLVQFAD